MLETLIGLYVMGIMIIVPLILIISYYDNHKKTTTQNKYTTTQKNNSKPIEPKQYLNYKYKKSESSNTYIDIYKDKRESYAGLKHNDNPLVKKYLMTNSERIVFEKIKNNLNNKYVIFPQICMRSILSDKFNNSSDSLWAIPDYLICTYPYYQPVMVVELDDKSHEKEERKIRDENLNNLLEKLDLPIWRLRNIKDYSRFDTDISIQIDAMLKAHNCKNQRY